MEQHPHLPSGPWTGFYLYGAGPSKSQHAMHCQLEFQDGQLSGHGRDDIGAFVFWGRYSLDRMTCDFNKKYLGRHQVAYEGRIDEMGIWGHWHILFDQGGFHLWPIRQQEETAEWACGAQVEEVVPTLISGWAAPKTPYRSTIPFR